MEAAQRIRLIRIIEKMEKNPAFSNKLGIKNTSEYLAEKEQKNERHMSEGVKNVIVIIYNLYNLVCWKIFCFWVKSILGNYEITLYSYFLPGDIDWYGCRWTDVHCFSIIDYWWHYSIGDVTFIIDQEEENRKYRQSITAYVKEKAMSQKWFIAFLGVMDYFNFSLSAFRSSRLSPCSPAVLSTQRFKESMAKEISLSFLLI